MNTNRIEKGAGEWRQLTFQAALALFTAATYLQNTMYTEYAAAARIFGYMRYLTFLLLAVVIISHILEDVKESLGQKGAERLKGFRYAACCLAVGLLTLLVSINARDYTVVFVAAFVLGARGKELKRVLRTSFRVQAGLMIFVILSCNAGIIPDLLIKRSAVPIRHSLGFTYPSVCMAYFFFLLLLYLWLYGEGLRGRDLFWIEIINYLLYLLTDSRMSFLMGTGLVLAAYLFCCKGAEKRCGRWIHKQKRVRKRFYKVSVILYDYYVVFLFLGYVLGCTLDWALGGKTLGDRLLSGRLGLTVSAVKKYGLHLLGSRIAWVGFGGTENTDALLSTYNYVDSSYGRILLNYGILVFLLVMAYVVFTQKYIRTREGVWKSLCMIFIWTYCAVEPRLLELQVNCFLLLGAPLLSMGPGRGPRTWFRRGDRKERREETEDTPASGQRRASPYQ